MVTTLVTTIREPIQTIAIKQLSKNDLSFFLPAAIIVRKFLKIKKKSY